MPFLGYIRLVLPFQSKKALYSCSNLEIIYYICTKNKCSVDLCHRTEVQPYKTKAVTSVL